MLTKTIRILVLSLALTSLFNFPASANNTFNTGFNTAILDVGSDFINEFTGIDKFSIKRPGEPYNEANDPAMHKSAPPEEPQHGYFIVSLLMLVGVGTFLYFLKID